MAAPTVAGTPTTTSDQTAATSHNLNLPTGITAGETLVMEVASKAPVNEAAVSGWTRFIDVNLATGSAASLHCFWKKAAGTESGTVACTTTTSTRMAAICRRWTGASDPTVSAPEGGTATLANTINPDPPSYTAASAKDYAALALFASSHGRTASAYPTNYATSQTTAGPNNGTATNIGMGSASLALSAATTENPGTFTTTGTGVEETASATYFIHPSAGGGTQFSQAVAATGTLSVGLPKQAGKPLALTATLAAVLNRGSFRTIAAAVTVAVAVTRQIPKILAVALTGTIGLVATRVKQQAIAATMTISIAVARSTAKILVATVTLVPAASRQVAKVIATTATLSAGVARRTAKGIATGLTLTAGFATTKVKQLVIAVSTSLAAGLVRRIGKSVAASLTGAIGLATAPTVGSVWGAPVVDPQAVLVWSAAQATFGAALGQAKLSGTPGQAVLKEGS